MFDLRKENKTCLVVNVYTNCDKHDRHHEECGCDDSCVVVNVYTKCENDCHKKDDSCVKVNVITECECKKEKECCCEEA